MISSILQHAPSLLMMHILCRSRWSTGYNLSVFFSSHVSHHWPSSSLIFIHTDPDIDPNIHTSLLHIIQKAGCHTNRTSGGFVFVKHNTHMTYCIHWDSKIYNKCTLGYPMMLWELKSWQIRKVGLGLLPFFWINSLLMLSPWISVNKSFLLSFSLPLIFFKFLFLFWVWLILTYSLSKEVTQCLYNKKISYVFTAQYYFICFPAIFYVIIFWPNLNYVSFRVINLSEIWGEASSDLGVGTEICVSMCLCACKCLLSLCNYSTV